MDKTKFGVIVSVIIGAIIAIAAAFGVDVAP